MNQQVAAALLPDLPDLDDLLKEAKTKQSVDKAAALAKERLRKGTATAAEREEDLARVRAWEMANDWRIDAIVARFTESYCRRCVDYTYLFTGLFERHQHRRQADAKRWVKTGKPVEAYEGTARETMILQEQVEMCCECMEQFGFTWDDAYSQDGRELRDLEAEGLAMEEEEPAPAGSDPSDESSQPESPETETYTSGQDSWSVHELQD